MYSILNRYIRKSIFLNIIMVFLTLVSLSSIIRLVDELRKIGKENYSIYEVVIYMILSIPKDFELFFPIATLLGGLLGLSMFEMNNEFMAMQVSGYSKLQFSFSVIKASIPVLLCNMIISEWVLPSSEKKIYSYHSHIKSDNDSFSTNIKNLWLIDNNDFIYVERILAYDELLGVTLYRLSKVKKIKKIFYIERVVFIDNIWHLHNINELDFSDDMHIISRKLLYSKWDNVTLTPDILSMITVHPNVLPISKLYYCIKYFNKVGYNSKYYQLIFWNKISSIFSGSVMMIMAVSCSFGPLYHKKNSIRLFFGSIVGFLFYILNQIFGILSTIYNIYPFIGSILPSVIFLLISLIIVWRYS